MQRCKYKEKGLSIDAQELITTLMMLYLQPSLLKVSGASRVTAFVLVAIKPKPEEVKEYDRNNRK